jgi:superfamily II DNA/RNA helicase
VKIQVLSGDLTQAKREQVLDAFRSKKVNILIATDVAARGLDIPEISHVFNYDLPEYEENYVHRVGRTSRMDRQGRAITLILEDQFPILCRIEGFINRPIVRQELPPRHSGGRESRPKTRSQRARQAQQDRERLLREAQAKADGTFIPRTSQPPRPSTDGIETPSLDSSSPRERFPQEVGARRREGGDGYFDRRDRAEGRSDRGPRGSDRGPRGEGRSDRGPRGSDRGPRGEGRSERRPRSDEGTGRREHWDAEGEVQSGPSKKTRRNSFEAEMPDDYGDSDYNPFY